MNLAQKNDLGCCQPPTASIGTDDASKPSYPSVYLHGPQAKDFEKEFPGLKMGEEIKVVMTIKPNSASVGEDGLTSLSLDLVEIKPHAEHKRPPQFEGLIGKLVGSRMGGAE
jgi:hypothetical protein